MQIYQVSWNISIDDEWVTSGSKLFQNELAMKRYEFEVMEAARLLQLENCISIKTTQQNVEE